MIPDGWRVETLENVADYSTGRTPSRDNPKYWEESDAAVPWVSISDMKPFATVRSTRERISASAFHEVFRARCAPAGTLLMSFKLTIGRVATLGMDACHNEAIIALRPKSGIDQRFLGYFLSQIDYEDLQDRQIKGNTLNQEKIDRLSISLPPVAEQVTISDALDLARSALDCESRVEAATRQLKAAALRELFTRGLRRGPQRESDFGAVPDAWRMVALDRCAAVQTGVAKGRTFLDTEMVDVPYLRVANVQNGHLDLREMKLIRIRKSEVDRYRLQTGDVVLTEGGDFDKLGRGFIWRSEIDLCVHQNHVFAVRPDRSRLLPEFFAYQAQSEYGRAYFLKVAHKTTNLACINSTKLKAFPVLIPPTLDEQKEIVEVLDAIDRKIDLHKRKRVVLEKLFNALLHKLVTGEIRVADLDLSALDATVTAGAAA